LRNLIDLIKTKKNEDRKVIPGLHPSRADVILAGAETLYEAMSYLGYADVKISDRGLKWGLFYECAS